MSLDNLVNLLTSDLKEHDYIKGIREEIIKFYTKKIILSEQNINSVRRIVKLLRKQNSKDKQIKIKKNENYKKLLHKIRRYFFNNYYSFLRISKKNKIYTINFSKLGQNELEEYKIILLKSHKSTSERLDELEKIENFFEEDVSKFFETKKFNNIIDLGCGFNPLLLQKPLQFNKYIFIDLNQLDINLITKFLISYNKLKDTENKFIGKDFDIYSEKEELLKFLQETIFKKEKDSKNNLVLMLKLIDNLENNRKNFSLELLKRLIKIGFSNFIISFSIKSFCGKEFNPKSRNWFFNFLEKNKDFNFKYKTLNTENELFILIKVIT